MSVEFQWVEKYRPQTIEETILPASIKKSFQEFVKNGELPNLLLTGSAGIGKTTVAKALCNEIGADFIVINGSDEGRLIDTLRTKIKNFASTVSLSGGAKVVILDEADYISADSVQPALRNFIEEFSSNCRFIFTCNYKNRIIPALHSRCQGFHINQLDQTEFTVRVGEILADNNVKFDLETLDAMVRANYPDLRKTINTVQMTIVDNNLVMPDENTNTSEWRLTMVELFKAGKIADARKLIIKSARPDEYNDIFTWLYKNLDLYAKDDFQYDSCVLAIREGMIKHTQVADPEINLSATLIEISRTLNDNK